MFHVEPQRRGGELYKYQDKRSCSKVLGHIYFDWKGPRGTVGEYGEKLKKACEKTGAKFKGIWGPRHEVNYVD